MLATKNDKEIDGDGFIGYSIIAKGAEVDAHSNGGWTALASQG